MEYLLTQSVTLKRPIIDTYVSEDKRKINRKQNTENTQINVSKERTRMDKSKIDRNVLKGDTVPQQSNGRLITSKGNKIISSNLKSGNDDWRVQNKVQTFPQKPKSQQSLLDFQNKRNGDEPNQDMKNCETPVKEKNIRYTEETSRNKVNQIKHISSNNVKISNINVTNKVKKPSDLKTEENVKFNDREMQQQPNNLPILYCSSENKRYTIKEINGKMECPF